MKFLWRKMPKASRIDRELSKKYRLRFLYPLSLCIFFVLFDIPGKPLVVFIGVMWIFTLIILYEKDRRQLQKKKATKTVFLYISFLIFMFVFVLLFSIFWAFLSAALQYYLVPKAHYETFRSLSIFFFMIILFISSIWFSMKFQKKLRSMK